MTLTCKRDLLSSPSFSHNYIIGWCSLRTSGYNASMHTVSVNISEVFAQVFVYMTYITLLVIYIFIRCSIRLKVIYHVKTLASFISRQDALC